MGVDGLLRGICEGCPNLESFTLNDKPWGTYKFYNDQFRLPRVKMTRKTLKFLATKTKLLDLEILLVDDPEAPFPTKLKSKFPSLKFFAEPETKEAPKRKPEVNEYFYDDGLVLVDIIAQ